MTSSDQWGTGISGAPLLSAQSSTISTAAALLQAKHRRTRGEFLLEGVQGVREALREPGAVLRVFVSAVTESIHADLIAEAERQGIEVFRCDERAFGRLATAVTPAGVVALCRIPTSSLPEVFTNSRLLVYLHEIGDPGNLGTIIRTADAAGADAVLLSPNSVDPFNDKALRSTVGSIFHIPVLTGVTAPDLFDAARSHGVRVLATSAAGVTLDAPEVASQLARATVWIFGSEAHGLPDAVAERADLTVAVPHYGRAESLNLGSAAAVCIYATAMAQHASS